MPELTLHDNVTNTKCVSCGEKLSKEDRDKYGDICHSCLIDAVEFDNE